MEHDMLSSLLRDPAALQSAVQAVSGLLGGTVIIEQVFTLNGLGSLAITSVRQLDVPMVMAEVLFIALITSIINLVVDVLYVYIDPRLKSQYVMARKARS